MSAGRSTATGLAARPLGTLPGGALFRALLCLDFTRPAAAAGLGVVYLLSRLPWLGLGYGADPDTYRVAIAARWLRERGEFYPSRLPGYPLHELLTAALYPGGAVLTNLSTLVVSFAGVLIFAHLLRRLAVEPKGLLTLAFAFAPMIWINSTVTLDYLWGLTFVLAAYLTLVGGAGNRGTGAGFVTSSRSTRRLVLAGALLGVAIGCRPTSALALLPLGVLLVRERQMRGALWFGVTAVGVAGLAFLPIALRYGTTFLTFYDVRPTWPQVARSLGVEAFGLATTLGFGVVLALSWRRLLRLPERLRRDVHLAVAVLMVLLLAATYMRLPLEEAYLAPAIPFGLIVMARLLSRRATIAICLLLIMGSVLDVYTRSDAGWTAPARAVAGLRPAPGRVLVDHELRRQRMAVADELRELPLPERSVVTAGFYYPIVAERGKDDLDLRLHEGFRRNLVGPLTDLSEARDGRDVIYVWLLTPGDAREYRAQGYRTFTVDWSRPGALRATETYLPEYERFAVR